MVYHACGSMHKADKTGALLRLVDTVFLMLLRESKVNSQFWTGLGV